MARHRRQAMDVVIVHKMYTGSTIIHMGRRVANFQSRGMPRQKNHIAKAAVDRHAMKAAGRIDKQTNLQHEDLPTLQKRNFHHAPTDDNSANSWPLKRIVGTRISLTTTVPKNYHWNGRQEWYVVK